MARGMGGMVGEGMGWYGMDGAGGWGDTTRRKRWQMNDSNLGNNK